jgi:hypothetical protein
MSPDQANAFCSLSSALLAGLLLRVARKLL